MNEEVESIALADKHARTYPRDKGAPSAWLRCNFVRTVNGVLYRCICGEGHTNAHRYIDEAEHDAAGKAA